MGFYFFSRKAKRKRKNRGRVKMYIKVKASIPLRRVKVRFTKKDQSNQNVDVKSRFFHISDVLCISGGFQFDFFFFCIYTLY